MTVEIPEFATEFAADALFRYQFKLDGELLTLTLKPVSEIPLGLLEDAYEAQRDGDDQAQTWAILKWGAATDEDRVLLRRLPSKGIPMIMDAWQKHGEIELGELSRLPDSSGNGATATPSKSTSSTPG